MSLFEFVGQAPAELFLRTATAHQSKPTGRLTMARFATVQGRSFLALNGEAIRQQLSNIGG